MTNWKLEYNLDKPRACLIYAKTPHEAADIWASDVAESHMVDDFHRVRVSDPTGKAETEYFDVRRDVRIEVLVRKVDAGGEE